MAPPKATADAKARSSPSPSPSLDATRPEPVGLSPADIKATSINTANVIPRAIKAAELLFLAAISSPVSQMTLSPVYGSIPPSLHHRHLIMAAVLLAWTVKKTVIHKYLPKNVPNYLPLLAFCIPTIQFFLFQQSGRLGATYGPLVTELFTYFPLVVLSIYSAAVLMDSIDLSPFDQRIQNTGPGIASYALFSIAQRASTYLIRYKMGSSLLFTRWGLQSGIAAFYAVLLPSRVLLFAILPMMHSASLNPHAPLNQTTDVLNATLHGQNYALLERQESLTGYISVLDNTKEGFRVMRCDHSLLGGEWLQQPNAPSSRLAEPIYSVFTMLEAVRLVETASSKESRTVPDSEKNALVIGLGIGTTPSALIAQGIDTTIVEIDPVVYEFATKYFHLPSNHTLILDDAMYFVGKALVAGPEHYSYDYIIHDVFTGGAEPVSLFTEGFLAGLRDILKPDGVVAINYAGDLSLPSASLIVHTVRSVFPKCRFFREDAARIQSSPSKSEKLLHDFTNMVMFCRKTNDTFSFRDPVEADCLGSQARRYHLLPKHELQASNFESRPGDGELHVLKAGHMQRLEADQKESAIGHWGIMRTVLPDVIWENW